MKLNKIYLLMIMMAFFAVSGYAQVAVIANKSVPENSINSAKLNEIYSLKTKNWSNGKPAVLFSSKDDNNGNKVFGSFGKSAADMKKLWMKLQLTGEGQAPEALASDEEIINKVASTPGAIGFIDASKANDKVKVLITIN